MALICAAIGAGVVILSGPIVIRPQPVVIDGEAEADGVIVRGGVIELGGIRRGDSTCPGATQRWLWRWKDPSNHSKGTDALPLISTSVPAYMPNGPITIYLPVPADVPNGDWFYRANTREQCSWLPAWLGGDAVHQSLDVPVSVRG